MTHPIKLGNQYHFCARCSDETVQTLGVSLGWRQAVGESESGLTLADAKTLLAAIQRRLVQVEVADYSSERPTVRVAKATPLKDVWTRPLNSLFGTISVRAPRCKPCRCSITSRHTLTPVAEIMADRCTAEYERIIAKLGAWMPYLSSCTRPSGGVCPPR
jgi:hypothetical protein